MYLICIVLYGISNREQQRRGDDMADIFPHITLARTWRYRYNGRNGFQTKMCRLAFFIFRRSPMELSFRSNVASFLSKCLYTERCVQYNFILWLKSLYELLCLPPSIPHYVPAALSFLCVYLQQEKTLFARNLRLYSWCCCCWLTRDEWKREVFLSPSQSQPIPSANPNWCY